MEENIQTEEINLEENKPKTKNRFWLGTLVGALSMFLICGLFGGATALLFAFGGDGPKKSQDSEWDDSVITAETIEKIKEIQAYIESDYLYYEDMDEEALQDAIIKGYVSGLEEPYSVYYDAKETKELFETTTGTFGGIGVGIQLDKTSGLITFTTIYPKNPGEEAGFKVGDIVYKVNGEDVSGQDLDTVVSKIRGEIGTQVEITVVRDGKEYTAKATRALIENETVFHEMKQNKIGYIQITGFEEPTYKQFAEAMDELDKKGMKGLVIDLRSNPGGNLSTVCQMCDLILPEGNVVSIKDRNGNGQAFRSDANTVLDVPLVVLVNQYSASASEIFASAVQDFGVGKIVGKTTYGKGIVQNLYELSDGTVLKITCSEYFSAKGNTIHKIGVKPDVEVDYVYDESNPTYDNQLEKAIEVLKKGM